MEHFQRCGPWCRHVKLCKACTDVFGVCAKHAADQSKTFDWAPGHRKASKARRSKDCSSLANLKKADEAVAERVYGVWACSTCGKTAPATVHQMRKTYCSKDCMAAAYRRLMVGEHNPNYKGELKRCLTCRALFAFRSVKERKYCSRECFELSGNCRGSAVRKNKLDKNHDNIRWVFSMAGAMVIDASGLGNGVPDFIVGAFGGIHLVEVKNPDSAYGRQGLSSTQQRWAKLWRVPVWIVTTEQEAWNLLQIWSTSVEILEAIPPLLELEG